jgi:hypothetical protein
MYIYVGEGAVLIDNAASIAAHYYSVGSVILGGSGLFLP